MMFTDWVPDIDQQYNIGGWTYCGLLGACIVFNFYIMMKSNYFIIKCWIKRLWKRFWASIIGRCIVYVCRKLARCLIFCLTPIWNLIKWCMKKVYKKVSKKFGKMTKAVGEVNAKIAEKISESKLAKKY